MRVRESSTKILKELLEYCSYLRDEISRLERENEKLKTERNSDAY